MLAERGIPAGSLDRWAVEPKLDGWRATVLVDDDKVVVRTRRGHAITETIPGIEALADGGRRFLLDGELGANAGRASDFYALLPRGRRATAPLSFWAFDLLWLDGDLLIDRPYADRRGALEELFAHRALRRPPPLPRHPAPRTSSPPARPRCRGRRPRVPGLPPGQKCRRSRRRPVAGQVRRAGGRIRPRTGQRQLSRTSAQSGSERPASSATARRRASL
jgi:hypothetical protein